MRAELPLGAGGGAAVLDSQRSHVNLEAHGAVAVISALASERRCLAAATRGSSAQQVSLLQSGPGPARATAAAREALAAGAVGLVSWGFAAGLDATLAPGTLLVPRRVLGPGAAESAVDGAWQAALREALRGEVALSEADLLTVSALLTSPAAKADAARRSGAAAADMESGAIAAVARAAGVPFVAVRVVLDAIDDPVPPQAARWVDAAGNLRRGSVAGLALKPWQWRGVLTLSRRHARACDSLLEAARRLLPLAFARPRRPAF